MGDTRDKMVEDLKLRGYADGTVGNYVRCAKQFVAMLPWRYSRPTRVVPTSSGPTSSRQVPDLDKFRTWTSSGPGVVPRAYHTAACRPNIGRRLARETTLGRSSLR